RTIDPTLSLINLPGDASDSQSSIASPGISMTQIAQQLSSIAYAPDTRNSYLASNVPNSTGLPANSLDNPSAEMAQFKNTVDIDKLASASVYPLNYATSDGNSIASASEASYAEQNALNTLFTAGNVQPAAPGDKPDSMLGVTNSESSPDGKLVL